MDYPNEASVLGQGFKFRPLWWSSRVSAECGGFLNELPAEDRDYHRINRADLVTAAVEHGFPQALLADYVWGTGASAFLVSRRARVFRDNDDQRISDTLAAVAEQVRAGNTADAYRSMLRGHRNYLKHLGPSFFTKFLYAAGAQDRQPGRALILDQFVAIALKDVDGWEISRTGPWDTVTYEKWLDHAHRIATVEGVRADAVELAYFKHGWKVARSGR